MENTKKAPIDPGSRETDKLLSRVEKDVAAEYRRAHEEISKKLQDYLEQFEKEDKEKQKKVAVGMLSQKDYLDWRKRKIAMGRRWEAMKETLAADYHNANKIAESIVRGHAPEAYAVNHNYMTYQIEHDSQVDTQYTLYSRETVERLLRENPQLLPDPRPGSKLAKQLAANKDLRWNKQHIQSALLQGILQGESVSKIADRIRNVSASNQAASVRYARTMVTGAQNAGRIDAIHRAEGMGIRLIKEWDATLDNRTRHSHRDLHGERVGTDEVFSNGCMFPGDTNGPPEEWWNCRCTLLTWVKGFEHDRVTQSPGLGSMSYEEWLGEHAEEPTIDGVRRGEPMTHSQADTGRVNPHFGDGGGYTINCQSCVATYEARLRGYDVEVVPNDAQHPMCGKLAADTKLVWKNQDGSKAEFVIGDGAWTWKEKWHEDAPTAKRFEKKLVETLDKSGRYTIQFKWRGFNAGHIVSIKNDNGVLEIYDPQSDQIMRGKQVSDYLTKMQYQRQYKGNMYYSWPSIIRVDDKNFNFDVANQIMRKVEKR